MPSETTPSLEEIAGWLNETYNYAMSVYVWDGRVRLTNGSAVHYVDIYPEDETFKLDGERYGERIRKRCEPNRDALLETLRRTI